MKPTDDLFQLIHSLSKSEKRYFNMHYSGEKVYEKIFDFIENQVIYDEKALVDRLKLSQIHVYKNYLYKLILKSLRSFHAEGSDSMILLNQLQNFEILFDKGHLKQAKKTLQKCKELAISTHKRNILGEIYQLERKFTFLVPRQKEKELLPNFLGQQEILEDKLALLRGQQLAYRISRHFYRTGLLLNEEIRCDIVDINTSIDEIDLDSNEFLIYKNWVKYFYNWMTGSFSDAFDAAEKFIHLIDHSDYVFDLSILSCEIAYCHARCTIKVKEINEYYFINGRFPENFLIHLPEGHLAENVIKIMNLYFFYEVGKFKEGLEYLDKIQPITQKKMTEASIVTLHAATNLHFCAANYKDALRCCNKIINGYKPGIADDFYIVNILIRIILHFEMENYEVAEDLIKKARIPLKKHNFFYPLDELLLNKLQSAMLADTKKKYLQHMLELDRESEKLMFENIIKLKIYFNFKDWIKAKASGIPFAEVILTANRKLLLE